MISLSLLLHHRRQLPDRAYFAVPKKQDSSLSSSKIYLLFLVELMKATGKEKANHKIIKKHGSKTAGIKHGHSPALPAGKSGMKIGSIDDPGNQRPDFFRFPAPEGTPDMLRPKCSQENADCQQKKTDGHKLIVVIV